MRTNPRIYGGQPAIDCQWPTVVDLSICSGVLVHPRIVVYAGHCGQQGEVTFGNLGEGFTISIDPSMCKVHPQWTLPGLDVAYCELPVEVTDVPLVHLLGTPEPLPEQGELVTLVGYGATEEGSTNGRKYYGEAPFLNLQEGELTIGGNGTDTCSGDSGGPAMAEQDDGTWRVIGITSRAEDSDVLCGGISRYTHAPSAAAWVEQQSGYDVTPCFDGAVAMNCDSSDDAPYDPAPAWCAWGEAQDETGISDSGEPSEDTSSVTSNAETTTLIPDDDPSDLPETARGCDCSATSPPGLWPLLLIPLFRKVFKMRYISLLAFFAAGCVNISTTITTSSDDTGNGDPGTSDNTASSSDGSFADTTAGMAVGIDSGESSGSGTDADGTTEGLLEAMCTDPMSPGEGDWGQYNGLWHSGCFLSEREFGCPSCAAWCEAYDLGACVYVETTLTGACEPFGTGINQLGLCDGNLFVNPAVYEQGFSMRCVCAGD
mgnify:CR=1 FL=1